VTVAKDVLGPVAKVHEITLAGDGEPLDGNAVDPIFPRPQFVAPGDIVVRARGEHANVSVGSQPLRDVASV
jgi:hypothetical protein